MQLAQDHLGIFYENSDAYAAPETIQKQFAFFAVLLCRLEINRQRLLQLAEVVYGICDASCTKRHEPIQQRPRNHPKAVLLCRLKSTDSVCCNWRKWVMEFVMPIQQRPRNHPKAICVLCSVALQAEIDRQRLLQLAEVGYGICDANSAAPQKPSKSNLRSLQCCFAG